MPARLSPPAVSAQIDADNIIADYAAGVLTLTTPVCEAAKPRTIEVTSSDVRQAVIG